MTDDFYSEWRSKERIADARHAVMLGITAIVCITLVIVIGMLR